MEKTYSGVIKYSKNNMLLMTERLLKIYKKKEIPKFLSPLVLIDMIKRKEFIELVGYQLLAHNWVNELCKILENRNILEICSGNGALSYILRQKGIDIVSTDNFEFKKDTHFMWTDIIEADCLNAIETYAPMSDYVLCSFFHSNYLAGRAISKMKEIQEVNKNLKMIVINSLILEQPENLFNVIEIQKTFNIKIEKINKILPCYAGIPVEIAIIK